jgi:menaquinone-dependent protoporphyrinogen oxidase
MHEAAPAAPQDVPATGAPVLVAYASHFGSTRGVAERIAATLREDGVAAVLADAAEAGEAAAYSAVVFGSAVYNQRWLPEGDEFVRANRPALASRPTWLFSVGTFGDGKRLIGPLMRREPHGIDELCRAISPRGYRVFAGLIERHRWPLRSRLFYHALGGRLGDNRDWPEIERWGHEIARALYPADDSDRQRGAQGPLQERTSTPRGAAGDRGVEPRVAVLETTPAPSIGRANGC